MLPASPRAVGTTKLQECRLESHIGAPAYPRVAAAPGNSMLDAQVVRTFVRYFKTVSRCGLGNLLRCGSLPITSENRAIPGCTVHGRRAGGWGRIEGFECGSHQIASDRVNIHGRRRDGRKDARPRLSAKGQSAASQRRHWLRTQCNWSPHVAIVVTTSKP